MRELDDVSDPDEEIEAVADIDIVDVMDCDALSLCDTLSDEDGVAAALELLDMECDAELDAVIDDDNDGDKLDELDVDKDALIDAVIDVVGVRLTDAPVDNDADIEDVVLDECVPLAD